MQAGRQADNTVWEKLKHHLSTDATWFESQSLLLDWNTNASMYAMYEYLYAVCISAYLYIQTIEHI